MNYNEISLSRPLSPQQSELEQKLLAQVADDNIRAVSFKLEEVLTVTPFSMKEDIFLLMEDDFKDLTAEKKSFCELRKAAYDAAVRKFGEKQSVTLDMVYDIFAKMSGVSTGYREKLMNRECELILRFTMPRKFGKKLFLAAKARSTKVIVTCSGIYPRSVIVNILSTCGLGSSDELIMCSELNIPAADQSPCFDRIIKKAGVPPQKILHIGSDVSADVETAIMKGMKAVLIQPVIPLMVKSGRLRGFVENRHIYDSDSAGLLVLRCAFAVYALYAFDTPMNKTPRSDFCEDEYLLGAAVSGISSLDSEQPKLSDIGGALVKTLSENKKTAAGKTDFLALYDSIFNGLLDKYPHSGCQLTVEFLEKHSAAADRDIMRKGLEPEIFAMWVESSTEPQLAPVHSAGRKKSSLDKLADRLFPPNTKVRNIVEGILHGGKNRR